MKKICVYYFGKFSEDEGVGNVAVNISKRLKGFDISYLTTGKYHRFFFYSFLSPLWFFFKIRKMNPDVVFVHGLESSFDPVLVKKFFGLKYKILVLAHGTNKGVLETYYSELKKGLVVRKIIFEVSLKITLARASFIKCVDKVTAVSRGTALEIRRFYGVKSEAIPNGCSFENRGVIRKKLNTILFIGNSYWRKGLYYLLEANNRLAAPKKVVVVGIDASQESSLRKLVDCNNVKFEKSVPHSELRRIYDSADIFAMPSINEAFGLVYLEALSNRLPVLASKGTGAEDIVRNNENGVLVGRANIESIRKGIIFMENNIERLSKNARVGKKFKWDSIAGKYDKILREMSD